MSIYRVWYQKSDNFKNYQVLFANKEVALGYAEGISNNEDINFVQVMELNADDATFEYGEHLYEHGSFNPLAEGWGYVI